MAKSKTEMAEVIHGCIARLAFDMGRLLDQEVEADGKVMAHLVTRAEAVGAAEATAELFVALLAEQVGDYSPTNVEIRWRIHIRGLDSHWKSRAQAAVRSITKFFNSWSEVI